MPPKIPFRQERRTHPLVWCAAIVCTILTLAVIIAGIVTFIGYLIIHPRVPYISVIDGHLDFPRLDYTGNLQVQMVIVIEAKNGNEKAHASFTNSDYILSLNGRDIAQLVAPEFDVRKNDSVKFNYLVQSAPIPLTPEEAEDVDAALKKDLMTFYLKGSARVRWRVGRLGSVKFLCRLDCQMHFHPSNGSYIPSTCTSKAK